MVKHSKPKTFYQEFTRKGTNPKITHYCPGCGHGTAHKLIAEIVDELGIQDRVIVCSPVGCSVFAYYYFDTGNIQCAHGRAPAVATGIRRSLKDAIIISYQGDGDLAGIGLAEIVHAANRGENITVFFINNAIYGMTGGQMAPTTLLGQKTMTTPLGRTMSRDGGPIGMAEVMDSLKAPVFIERVSLSKAPRIIKARRAFKKAIQNQIDGKGFSFVEALSPCPINWKMTASEARRWIEEKLEPIYPVKNFRDREPEEAPEAGFSHLRGKKLLSLFTVEKNIEVKPREKEVEDQLVKIAGFGGQGVMSAGVLLANCTNMENLKSTWLPSYGPEMRGGTANASVIISERIIGSPVVDHPNVLIAMNGPSLDSFEDSVAPGGLIIVNSSLIKRKVKRSDVNAFYVPATDLAKEVGFIGSANIIVLAVYLKIADIINMDTLREIIPLSIKKKEYISVNLKAIDRALEFFEQSSARSFEPAGVK